MTATRANPTVLRTLGFAAAASVAISNMIGQGVFLKARAMTCNVGSPTMVLAAWVVAGLLALCGALTLGELGAAIPESGGLYAFLRRAYGKAAAFAYGWMILFVGSPASIAALSVGAAIFFNLWSGHALDRFGFATTLIGVHVVVSGIQWAALLLIAGMTAVNCAPAVANGRLATAFAGLKIAMLVAITVAAFAFGHGDATHFAASGASGTCNDVAASMRGGVAGFAAALIGALYAYNGWHSLILVAGEVKAPGRIIPAALIVSVALVIVLYVGANAAFVYVLSPLTIASLPANQSVGVAVVETLFGPTWRSIAAALLFASVVATLHVSIFTNSRVTYAVAKDFGVTLLGRVSRHGHVPVNAVLTNSGLAALLVLLGTFDALSNYLVFNSWVFFVAGGAAMFVLRRREPAMSRPYRTVGYPIVPAVYIAVGTWLLIQTAISAPVASSIGVALVLLSVPVYFRLRRNASISSNEST